MDQNDNELRIDYEADVDCFAGELNGMPSGVAGFAFERTDLAEVRRRVEESAEAVGISSLDVAAVVVAASELAANSIAHGGGAGTLRIWIESGKLLIEIKDGGRIGKPLVGRLRPTTTQEGGQRFYFRQFRHVSQSATCLAMSVTRCGEAGGRDARRGSGGSAASWRG